MVSPLIPQALSSYSSGPCQGTMMIPIGQQLEYFQNLTLPQYPNKQRMEKMQMMNQNPGEELDRIRDFFLKVKQATNYDAQIFKQFKDLMLNHHQYDISQFVLTHKNLLKNHSDLVSEFVQFLPEQLRQQNEISYNDALEYLNEVKIHAAPIYQQFVEILKKLQKEEMSINEVKARVTQLLGKEYKELLDKFQNFLPEFEKQAQNEEKKKAANELKNKKPAKQGGQNRFQNQQQQQNEYKKQYGYQANKPARMGISGMIENDSLIQGNGFQGFNKSIPRTEHSIMDSIRNNLSSEHWAEFVKCFSLYFDTVICYKDLIDLVTPIFDKYKDKLGDEYFSSIKSMISQKEINRRQLTQYCRPFSEVEQKETIFEKTQISYYKLNEMFPRFSYSGMTDLDKALVNQDYLSQSNWTENYKSKNRNIYEEAIFKVEDEMTGFDQSIGNFQRTLELMQAEIIKLAAMSDQERNDYVISKFRFNAIRLSIVEELYQDKAQGMIQLIFKNPSRALPIIVDRIEKKLKFYEQGKRDTIRVWVEQMEKNWSKSLDIRSVTFKAFEKKHEQSKSYVDELKHRAGERAHRRDANHLKGGTRSCEYYVMLEIFEHIEVYDDNDLSDPRIANDSPMNLVDKVYLERTDKLPHFRFLMNDDYFLDLTNSLVYASIQGFNHSSSDRDKMEKQFKFLTETFMKNENFANIEKQSNDLPFFSSKGVDTILSRDYYDFKLKQNFNYLTSDDEDNGSPSKKGAHSEEQKSQIGVQQSVTEQSSQSPTKSQTSRMVKPLSIRPQQSDPNLIGNSSYLPFNKPEYQLMFSSQHVYIYFKIFVSIYQRIKNAYKLIEAKCAQDQPLYFQKDQLETVVKDKFNLFIAALNSLIFSNIDFNKYEDICRVLLGSKAYLQFYIEKLLQGCTKSLVIIANEDQAQRSMKIFEERQEALAKDGNDGKWIEKGYEQIMHRALMETNNFNGTMIRFLYSPLSKIMSVHYLGLTPSPPTDKNAYRDYAEKMQDQEFMTSVSSDSSPPFLRRNLKLVKQARKDRIDVNLETGFEITKDPISKRIMPIRFTEETMTLGKRKASSVLDQLELQLMKQETFKRIRRDKEQEIEAKQGGAEESKRDE